MRLCNTLNVCIRMNEHHATKKENKTTIEEVPNCLFRTVLCNARKMDPIRSGFILDKFKGRYAKCFYLLSAYYILWDNFDVSYLIK